MTYCLAIATEEGLVFCSDSRTNAGPDMISSYSKMHLFQLAKDRVFCVLSAGNLATTQAIIHQLELDIEDAADTNLLTCRRMIEAARYVAKVSFEVQTEALKSAGQSGIDTSASLIFGGQIIGKPPAIYMVYPAGNFITDSEETPYLQIGESKYGKPILDRILNRNTTLEDAVRCAIVSMDSTIKSNATVGPPIEVLVYKENSLSSELYLKLNTEHPYLRDIRQHWDDFLKAGFSTLPLFQWEFQQPTPDEFPPMAQGPQMEPANSTLNAEPSQDMKTSSFKNDQ